MKKLLNLLLLMVTTITFAQGNGEDYQLEIKVNGVGNNPTEFSVGDTFVMQFFTTDVTSGTDHTLVQFDYQYNNKLLEKVSHEFTVLGTNPNALTSLNEYNGYNWKPTVDLSPADLSGQYQQGSYDDVNQSDWSVGRVTIQNGSPIVPGSMIEVTFKVKDVSNTEYTDYSEVAFLNWANFKDNVNDITLHVWDGEPAGAILGQVGGGALGTITLKLNTPVTNKSDYRYQIEPVDEDGMVEYTNSIYGEFDAAGEAVVEGLTDGQTYRVFAFVNSDYNQDTQTPNHPAWLDDVVTISDVYLVFNYISSTDIDGNGTGTFDYYLQKLFSDITHSQSDMPGPGEYWPDMVNDNDSYVFLAYLAGTLPEPDNQTGDNFYPISSTKYGSMNYNMLLENYGKDDAWRRETVEDWVDPSEFIANYELSVVQIGHGLHGDVDLSHSHTPSTSGYSTTTSAKSVSLGKVKNTAFSKVPENSNLDITTQLVDGKVILEISTTKAGMAGAQVNLNYDTSRLEFSEVIFDSGNTMTNFANEQNGKIFIGSLDLKGGSTVKSGTPYKVIFTPKETLSNTAGLVSFGVTEGVKTDGTKVKFNIQ